jgi:simple sugar transport system permease protein
MDFVVTLLQVTLRTTAPLLMAALGGMYSERSGVISIGMEGFMIMGAFIGFASAFFSGSMLMGVAAAGLAGLAVSYIYGFLTIKLGGSGAVVGTACVAFSIGATGFFNRVLFGVRDTFSRIVPFQEIHIPFLAKIPVLGQIFFQHNILVYIAFLLVPASWFFIYRTAFGLELRSVGEHPKAADTVGLNVHGYRMAGVLTSGFLGGVAGGYLSLAHANTFIELMTAERGYIAFVIIIFGKYNPVGILFASLIFGFAEAFQIRLQILDVQVPYQFLTMLPYVVTLVAMVLAGKTVAPNALGLPYNPFKKTVTRSNKR